MFSSRLGYAYGVCDKSMAGSSVHSYFIIYFDAVTSITSPTGGNCLLNTCKRFAFSRAAVMFARTTCTLQVTYQLNYFLLEKEEKYIIAFTLYYFSSSPPPATAIFSGASSTTSLFIVISYYVPENRMS